MWQSENRTIPPCARRGSTILLIGGRRIRHALQSTSLVLCLIWSPPSLSAAPEDDQQPVRRNIAEWGPPRGLAYVPTNYRLDAHPYVPSDIVDAVGRDSIRMVPHDSPGTPTQSRNHRRGSRRPANSAPPHREPHARLTAELLRRHAPDASFDTLQPTVPTASQPSRGPTSQSVIAPSLPAPYQDDLQTCLIVNTLRQYGPGWNEFFPTNAVELPTTTDWTATLLARQTARNKARNSQPPTPPATTSHRSAQAPVLGTSITLGLVAFSGMLWGHASLQRRILRKDARHLKSGGIPRIFLERVTT